MNVHAYSRFEAAAEKNECESLGWGREALAVEELVELVVLDPDMEERVDESEGRE